MIKDISCVLIVKDAQKTIDMVLKSLSIFEDVVVYSNNSTDKTNEIVKRYNNVKLIVSDFIGFGATKNKASIYAKNDWILSLDGDEVLTQEFISNLSKINLDLQNVYSITRTNYYKNKQIKYCWKNDTVTRLYNKNITSFTSAQVHEKIITNNLNVVSIEGLVNHYPYSNINDFMIKADRYSSLFAEQNVNLKQSSPAKALFNSIYSFFKTYILKGGFLDGYAGLLISFSHMNTNFYKYMKLYELNKGL